ncbi:MAG: hypothetical protein Q4B94_09085 [Pseudomonadota bacterium]|nr:hypothetical protein [Pseudomonadota bacterium]
MKYDPRTHLSFNTKNTAYSSESLKWYHIALGVFIALMAHSIITGIWVRYETKKQIEEMNAELKKMSSELEREFNQFPTEYFNAPLASIHPKDKI